MDNFSKNEAINKNRIDLVVGISYVFAKDKKLKTNFFIDLHLNLKKSWNNLYEEDWAGTRDGKTIFKGKHDFLQRFDSLIDSIRKCECNTAPIKIYHNDDIQPWVFDGYHRYSILYYYNFNADLTFVNEDPSKYHKFYPTDINFFKKRGLPKIYCEYIVHTFLRKYKLEFSCIILFPDKRQLPDKLYNEFCDDILYELEIKPTDEEKFTKNFIQSLYYEEEWCRWSGGAEKAKNTFKNNSNLKIIFIEKWETEKLKELKDKIREYYNVGKHSVHTPDTQKEVNHISDMLNANTIEFLRQTPTLYNNFKNFQKYFSNLKKFCEDKNIDTERVCITSSAVLSVYCIRDCGDIDLFVDKEYIDIFKNTEFDVDNQYTLDGYYPIHFEDIIYNPENYFYYEGFKFCKLQIINEYKKYRVENKLFGDVSISKDKDDIKNMETVLSKKHIP